MISVIVPAFNEEPWIGPLLTSLLRQTDRPDEVIVVENGSTDETGAVVEGFAEPFSASGSELRLVRLRERGVARARNKGIQIARGNIVASTDADCYVASGWISAIRSHFRDTDSIGVTGKTYLFDAPMPLRVFSRMWGAHRWFHWIVYSAFGFYVLSTNNCAFLRSAAEMAGGFDEGILDPSGLDDFEFSVRMSAQGRVRYNSRMCVGSSHRRFVGGLKGIRSSAIRMKSMYRILSTAKQVRREATRRR